MEDIKSVFDRWVEKTAIHSSFSIYMTMDEYKTLIDSPRKDVLELCYNVLSIQDNVGSWNAILLVSKLMHPINIVPGKYAGRYCFIRDVWLAVLKEELGYNK